MSSTAHATTSIRGRTRSWKLLAVSAWIAVTWFTAPARAAEETPAWEPTDGDTVVFLGSAFTEQEIKHNHLETALSAAWPERTITFRNLGWTGDTPAAAARGHWQGGPGYPRLMDELAELKPSVVFLFYGSTSIEAPATFVNELQTLVTDIRRLAARVVVVTPPLAEAVAGSPVPVADINAGRAAIAQMTVAHCRVDRLPVIDLHALMRAGVAPPAFTHDGLQFTEAGYRWTAELILRDLGVAVPTWTDERMTVLRELIGRKNRLDFAARRPNNQFYFRRNRSDPASTYKADQAVQQPIASEISTLRGMIAQQEARIRAHLRRQALPPEPQPAERPERTVVALSPEEEMQTLRLDEGLAVNLFAAEPQVVNPLHMHFDHRGRLWVACSPNYPHLRTGAEPSDQIIILEDTDGDGDADIRTVFADDLDIPTGLLPDGNGGVYVGCGSELLHLGDRDGDGRHDHKRVVLSGFGTQDMHHSIHTLTWGPDGAIYFNQSLFIASNVETPYGVRRMQGGCVWRFLPDQLSLEPFTYGMVNPWGFIFDRWGQSFATDGAWGDGINYAFPGAAFWSSLGRRRSIRGLLPGQPKLCSLVAIDGGHFPGEWQGTMLANDFRGNRTVRFRLEAQGSGYSCRQLPDVISSKHQAFRPVDLKLGPDGALYVADWYNPIIQHGEVDLRDPRRDNRHGRIWRITMKDRPLHPRIAVAELSITDLLEVLRSPLQATREHARRRLADMPADDVRQPLLAWLQRLPPTDPGSEQARLEALWLMQALGMSDPALLGRVLRSPDHRVRAAATRVLGFAAARIPDGLELLLAAATDVHPQVRLEAVNAARAFPALAAVEAALRVLDHEMDPNLDFALLETVDHLQPYWTRAVADGTWPPAKDPTRLLFLAKAGGSTAALTPLVELLAAGKVPGPQHAALFDLVGRHGTTAELDLVFAWALAHPGEHTAALAALAVAATTRNALISTGRERIVALLPEPQALRLAGLWRVEAARSAVIAAARAPDSTPAVRSAAVAGLAAYRDHTTLHALATAPAYEPDTRAACVQALITIDLALAADAAATLLQLVDSKPFVPALVTAFVKQPTGPDTLVTALRGKSIPGVIATEAFRLASATGQRAMVLTDFFRHHLAENSSLPQVLDQQSLAELCAEVAASGDPKAGERIYRRTELACISCHAIGGAGGGMGPDLSSLGGSAQIDYIVESLLAPSARIKEGYQLVSIVTDDGQSVIGMEVRSGGGKRTIKDPTGREIDVDDARIRERVPLTSSLMPPGLTASLKRREFIDLTAFLAALGRTDGFKVPRNRYVRRWLVDGVACWSDVDGSLPIAGLAGRTLEFALDVGTAGILGLTVSDAASVRLAVAGTTIEADAQGLFRIPAETGRLSLSLALSPSRTSAVLVELVDVAGSPGRAESVRH